jgi:hypothetical protein
LLWVTLPEAHFNSKTVSVETAEGTWSIPIEYEDLLLDGSKSTTLTFSDDGQSVIGGTIHKDVLTPIEENLIDGHRLKIVAQIPQKVLPAQAYAIIHFNRTFLKLIDSTYQAGTIIWTLEWDKLPTEIGEGPQLVDVVTTNWNGLFGASSVTSKIVQGYTVSHVVIPS